MLKTKHISNSILSFQQIISTLRQQKIEDVMDALKITVREYKENMKQKISLRACAIRMSNKFKKQTRISKGTPGEKSFSSAKSVYLRIAGSGKTTMSWASFQDCATGTSRTPTLKLKGSA